MIDIQENILSFCVTATPSSWSDQVPNYWQMLLVDHAHCERKAADFGLGLLKSYPDQLSLQMPISKLVREEMRHFELVLMLLERLNIEFIPLSPCRYAKGLHAHVRQHNRQERLLDLLIIAALIEARSCERFLIMSAVFPDQKVQGFYQRLYEAEKRHYQDYRRFANDLFSPELVERRLEVLRAVENDLILTEESVFRFHSGVPHKLVG